MSKITAILEPNADGTVHLPLPEELRGGKVRVIATLEAEIEVAAAQRGTPLEALTELRKLGGLRRAIPDPAAWQRDQRRDRTLPGRD